MKADNNIYGLKFSIMLLYRDEQVKLLMHEGPKKAIPIDKVNIESIQC